MAGEIKTGLDGKKYMVFPFNLDCEEYMEKNNINAPIACFGQYENAYLLPEQE